MITRGSVRRKSKEVFQRVIELRKDGHSYSEIAKETGIAKSTINNWITFAGLNLSPEHLQIQLRKRLENHAKATLASRVYRLRKKENDISLFMQNIKDKLSDPFFVAGVMLYEAEGNKGKGSNGFSNSDFRLVKMYINFLEHFYNLNKHIDMTFRIYIHDLRKNDLSRIINFWSKKLGLGYDEFKISWKHNKASRKRLNKDYVGQLNVTVKGFRYFTSKMLAVSDIILTRYQRFG